MLPQALALEVKADGDAAQRMQNRHKGFKVEKKTNVQEDAKIFAGFRYPISSKIPGEVGSCCRFLAHW